MTEAVRRNIPKPEFLTEEQWKLVLEGSTKEKQKESSERDVEMYIKTDGKGEHVFDAMNMAENTLVLTVIGRKSGQKRSTALLFIKDGDDIVVVGSTGGLPKDPQWWLNLKQTPEAWVQIGPDHWPVLAREASPLERQRLWAEVIRVFPLWGHFQKYSERIFPVIILSKR